MIRVSLDSGLSYRQIIDDQPIGGHLAALKGLVDFFSVLGRGAFDGFSRPIHNAMIHNPQTLSSLILP
jgi:hypothetical protein